MNNLPSGTVTFLFTDIEGSTDLAQKYPDALPALLARHHAILRSAVESHRGHVFRIAGDAFSCAFFTAADGLAAALDAQRRLHSEPWQPAPVRVRMGLNTGAAQAGVVDDLAGGYAGYSTLARAQRVMSVAHGGQILLSNSTADLVRDELAAGVSLRDLGEHRLKGLVNAERLWQVVAPDLPHDFPPLASLAAIPSNLPTALSRLVGRQRELAEIQDRLNHTRLLTLLGPGGTGKTRLALQAAANLMDRFAGGVYFVDLAPLRDPAAVVGAIARTVGVRETSDKPLLDELKGELKTRKMLLLNDNFEQVTTAAPTMAELLQDCPELKMLVTSREALRVRGETIYPVPPLALPHSDGKRLSVDELAQSEAVQLFIERARAVKPDFELTPENASAVAELCIRLDGLPLAIELATARLKVLSPQALVERLGSRLKLLRGGARDLPERQQTLRDTIDWSYEMLDPGEQRLFQMFSVFSGATFEAVEQVASQLARMNETGMDVLEGVSSLVDKSLIRQIDRDASESRLMMLETIREFAGECLAEDAEYGAAARRAHAAYYADWAKEQWSALTGSRQQEALDRMTADIDNLQAAWRYWVAEGNIEQLGKLTDSLWRLYDVRGWYHATVALTTDLLSVLSASPPTPERALEQVTLQTSLARALLATRGYTPEVEEAYNRALALCEGEGKIPQLFPVLRGLSSFYMYRAEFDKGTRIGEQILELAERNNDDDMRVDGYLVLGSNTAFLHSPHAGLALLEKGIAAFDPQRYSARRYRLGNHSGIACHTTTALLYWMIGFPDRALERANRAVAIAAQLKHPSSTAYAFFHTALLHLWRGEPQISMERALVVLDLAEEHDFQVWGAVGSILYGAGLAATGSPHQGFALTSKGIEIYRALRTPPVFWPDLVLLHATVTALAGKPAEALALLEQEVVPTRMDPDQATSTEFSLLKGDLLLTLDPKNLPQAEALYRRAQETTAAKNALMFELRACLKLAPVWRSQGKTVQARDLLSKVYAKFTEGFDTAPLRQAHAMMEEMA